jgi:hypothetical protein
VTNARRLDLVIAACCFILWKLSKYLLLWDFGTYQDIVTLFFTFLLKLFPVFSLIRGLLSQISVCVTDVSWKKTF